MSDFFRRDAVSRYSFEFFWQRSEFDKSAERFYDLFTDIVEAVNEEVELDVKLTDFGIGPFEFWGAKGTHTDIGPEIQDWKPNAEIYFRLQHQALPDEEYAEMIRNVTESIKTGLHEYGRKSTSVRDEKGARCEEDVSVEDYDCRLVAEVQESWRTRGEPRYTHFYIQLGWEVDE